MKLRFDIDQADCLLNGIDAPKSTATVEVDPKDIPKHVRPLIAERLYAGINVVQLWNGDDGTTKMVPPKFPGVNRVIAKRPTIEALLAAVIEDAERVKERRACHESIAVALAQGGEDFTERTLPAGLQPPEWLVGIRGKLDEARRCVERLVTPDATHELRLSLLRRLHEVAPGMFRTEAALIRSIYGYTQDQVDGARPLCEFAATPQT